MVDKRNGYSLEDDLMPIIDGKVAPPNFELVGMEGAIANIAATGHRMTPRWGYALIDGRKTWTFYFLTPVPTNFGGGFDGGGYMLLYGGYPHGGRVGKFAICKHEKVDAPGANHSRGWHPGHCTKCGLDMTVDSGD